MILHLSDDSIFLDYTIDQFEAVAPGQSIYLVSTSTPKKIKNSNKIVACESNSEKYKLIINRLSDFDAIILHSLTIEKAQMVNKASKNVNFVWMMWGADGFYLKEFDGRWYSEKTKKLVSNPKEQTLKAKIKKTLRNTQLYNLYYFLRKGKSPSNIEKVKAIKRIQFLAPVIKEDFTIIKEKFRLKAIEYLPYSHGSIETLITDIEKRNNFYTPKKNRILLGNSADPSNNHIDIFYHLKALNFVGEVICPLSYGHDAYKDKIIIEGKRILGSSFIPLVEFLPLEQYQEIISSCNIVIMNHYRQQAMGNITSAIWFGAKVFLNQKNPAYHFYNRIGVKVLTIQEGLDELSKSEVLINTTDHIIKNRNIFSKNFSQEAVLTRTKELIETIC
jgi:dTDP-N-acetylfucosamine:lipid II N-acetylfucosaminyltransferase